MHAGVTGIDVRILQVLLSLLILSSRYSLGKDPILAIGPIRSDELLTLETSAFHIFHGGNSTFINSFHKTKFLL